METLILKGQEQQVIPCVATIGMFDGVHRGHRFVLDSVKASAQEYGLASTVITFDKHPREVIQEGWKPQLLTTYDERMSLLEETGVDRCVVLSFTREMATLSACDFIRLMARQLGVKVLLTGYDNRFGHNRSETFDDYVRYGKEVGMRVEKLPPANTHHPEISSSVIRRLLEKGDVRETAQCLTYPYRITGEVVKGEHVGTRLGFPTANLQVVDPRKMIPAAGVYAVRCMMDDGKGKVYKGMMNIGTRPTFGEHPQTLEVHLLDYRGDLYGQEITLTFVERLREERRFDSEEALKAQLEEDKRRIEILEL